MKTSLLLCAVLFLAFSTHGQCRLHGGKIEKPLRVRLVMEADVPVAVQSAFLNGLHSIPDIEVRSGVGEEEDVVIYVMGFENETNGGTNLGAIWAFEVDRTWLCRGVNVALSEELDFGLHAAPSGRIEAAVKDQVAEINVKALEKLREERDAPTPK